MKKLLNTLYVLTPDSYLFCRNETIAVKIGGEEKTAVPAKDIEAIVCFGQMTVSTPLLQFCGDRGISITFLSPHGHFYGRFYGQVSGNVLLRKKQYESMACPDFAGLLVRDILLGKIKNSKTVLMRAARKNEDAAQSLTQASNHLSQLAVQLESCGSIDSMRGIEGAAATIYFSQFDCMLHSPAGFRFETRSRRPPANEVNAVLSFVYTLLTREICSALETVGLDPAAGYLHTLRPGRPSFALDLIEELRAPLCDRFVLSLFNLGQLGEKDFERDFEAVFLNERGRRTVLSSWQKRKGETVQHPFLREKIPIGMIPYSQAMLFARVLRGDLDRYPPFVWRYQTFIVDYRLRPYTQQEGALDVARAVRFVRQNAEAYGIDPDDIAVMGYSAGGIQAGEFFLRFDEDVNGTALDPDYVPDALDAVPAHASAAGMIYSFYGRLSVASMDEEELKAGDLPPTFYCYGTEDPFYRQFEAQYGLMQQVGIATKRIVLQDWPHGFGGDGGWVTDYAQWLEQVFALN